MKRQGKAKLDRREEWARRTWEHAVSEVSAITRQRHELELHLNGISEQIAGAESHYRTLNEPGRRIDAELLQASFRRIDALAQDHRELATRVGEVRASEAKALETAAGLAKELKAVERIGVKWNRQAEQEGRRVAQKSADESWLLRRRP